MTDLLCHDLLGTMYFFSLPGYSLYLKIIIEIAAEPPYDWENSVLTPLHLKKQVMDSAVPFSMSYVQRYVQVPALGCVAGKMGLGL